MVYIHMKESTINLNILETKVCCGCGFEKPIKDFYKRQYLCKPCNKHHQILYYKKNRTRILISRIENLQNRINSFWNPKNTKASQKTINKIIKLQYSYKKKIDLWKKQLKE